MTTMLRRVGIKFFLSDESEMALDSYIPIFHQWIREKRIPNTLLIDVADYRHVPNGPGVLLIADEAHYGMDSTSGEDGLQYTRLRDELGPAKQAMAEAIKRAAFVASAIEEDPTLAGAIRFRTDKLTMHVHDRLVAPNLSETTDRVEPILRELLEEIGYRGVEIESSADPRSRFELRVRKASTYPSLASLC